MEDTADNAARRAAAIELLNDLQCPFTPQADGSLFVPGRIDLSNKKLTILPDLSMVDVGEDFFCDGNQLENLKGAPRAVAGTFDCSKNELVTLEGAPIAVWNFVCEENPALTSLEHAPQDFKKLDSDLGYYSSWDEVPRSLRLSEATRARLEKEVVRGATVLQSPLAVRPPLSFRK